MTDDTRTLDEIYHELNELNTKAHEIILILEKIQDEVVEKLNKADAAALAEEALKDGKEPLEEAAAAETAQGEAGNYQPGMHWDEKAGRWTDKKPVHDDAAGQQELEIW